MLLITFTAAFSVGVELNETLRAAGARRGLYIGSQFKGATIQTDAAYRQKHSREFSLSTVGNMCKWHSTHPSKETFDLEPCNEAFAYARSAGQQFRGHNLCWGNDNPSWLENGKFTAAQLESLLRTHITHVMRGVKAAANGTSPLAWDVVNEATNDTAFFKPNTWYPALPSYVDIAFSAAREADPSTLLFYNDYSVAAAGGKKSEQMYHMVQSMVSRKVPIDGVGLQAHLALDHAELVANARTGAEVQALEKLEAIPTESAVSANIARYGRLGLQVHITELDVKCPTPCSASMLSKQADVYGLMLRACLANPGVCTSFETWGFTDKYTWLTGDRCPAEACHPLPFNESYAPKPAASRMLWLLHGGGGGGQKE